MQLIEHIVFDCVESNQGLYAVFRLIMQQLLLLKRNLLNSYARNMEKDV